MSDNLRQAEIIIRKGIENYKPKKFVFMVSGGHDSVTNAHVSATILTELGIPFEVYHGDTTTGIPAVQDYVRKICNLYGWKLSIRKPPDPNDHYRAIVIKYGFPGHNKQSHQFMYRRLKERALRAFVTYECKSKPLKRENIMLLSGVRQQESKIRMGYKHVTTKERSKIWCNPIFFWSEDDCSAYMLEHGIPRNPVKDTIGISGECLCGAFADYEEYCAIKTHYPNTGAVLDDLYELAKENGHDWPWWTGPPKKVKERKGTICKVNYMCAGCAEK